MTPVPTEGRAGWVMMLTQSTPWGHPPRAHLEPWARTYNPTSLKKLSPFVGGQTGTPEIAMTERHSQNTLSPNPDWIDHQQGCL